jgi:hypothetical protein
MISRSTRGRSTGASTGCWAICTSRITASQRAYRKSRNSRSPAGKAIAGLPNHAGDRFRIKLQPHTEIWKRRRRFDDLAGYRKINAGNQVAIGIVAVPISSEFDHLPTLGDHAERRFRNAEQRLIGARYAMDLQVRAQSIAAILRHGPEQRLQQRVVSRVLILQCLPSPHASCRIEQSS